MPEAIKSLDELKRHPVYLGMGDPDKVQFAQELFPEEFQGLAELDAHAKAGVKVPEIRASGPIEQIASKLSAMGPIGEVSSRILQASTDPAMAGATVGEILTMASPAGRIPGAMQVGATVGGAAGQGIKRFAKGEPVFGAGGTEEMLRAGGEQGIFSGAGELAARGLTRVSLLFGGGTLSRRIPIENREAIEQLGPHGVRLLASEATDSALLDVAQNLAESGIGSSGLMARFFKRRGNAISGIKASILDEIGPSMTPAQQAALFLTEITEQGAMSKLFTASMHQEFTDAVGHLPVNVSGLQRLGQRLVDKLKGINNIGSELVGLEHAQKLAALPPSTPAIPAKPGIPAVKDAVGNIIREAVPPTPAVPAGPPILTISQLDEIRQLLGDIKRRKLLGAHPPQRTQNFLDKTIASIDTLIDKTVKDPKALALYRDSNALVAQRYDTIDSDLLKKLVELSDPGKTKGGPSGFDAVVDVVFANTDNVVQTRRALGDSPEMRQLERRFMERVLGEATDTATQKLSGAKILKELVGSTGEFNERFAAQITRPDIRKNILGVAKALNTIESQKRQKVGKIAIQLTQGGLLIAALTGRADPTTAAVTFLGPVALAGLLLSRRGSNLLLKTVEAKASTKGVASLVARLADTANRIALEDEAAQRFGHKRHAKQTPSFSGQFTAGAAQ